MLTFRGLLSYALLVITLIASSACEKRCRQGAALVNGRCLQHNGAEAASGGAPADGDAGPRVLTQGSTATGANEPGSSPRSGSTKKEDAGTDAGGDKSTSTAAGSTGANAAGSSGADGCQPAGATRCMPQAARVESCVDGKWTEAQTCAAEEVCVEMVAGQASCAPAEAAPAACAGLMCDGACVPNDDKNCGTCGHDCTQLANVSGPATCEAGVCSYPATSCEPGFAHCSDNPDDGCETNLAGEQNCGGCAVVCPATAPVCAMVAGTSAATRTYECSTGCSTDAPALCGMSCIDVMSDAQHCGACDKPCPAVPNGQAVCENGTCSKKCNANHHPCGANCVSDRSTDSCGSECSPCPTPSGAQPTCDGSSCDFMCTSSRALKCDDGCFPNDDRNCGSCGNNCASRGEVCQSGECVECRGNSDCGGSTRYCVQSECRECQPGDDSTCGDCETCSSSGTCTSAGTPRICYRDDDGDGYGGKTSPQTVCGDCPSGTVTNNMDCFDSASDPKAGDVHPGQSAYFETGYGSGESDYDYDCNGRDERQALNPNSRQVRGACTCNTTSNMCVAPSMVDTPCGQRGSECISGANGCGTCGEPTPSWVIQGCR